MTREIPSWTLPNTATTSSMLSSNDVAVKFCSVDRQHVTHYNRCSMYHLCNTMLSEIHNDAFVVKLNALVIIVHAFVSSLFHHKKNVKLRKLVQELKQASIDIRPSNCICRYSIQHNIFWYYYYYYYYKRV